MSSVVLAISCLLVVVADVVLIFYLEWGSFFWWWYCRWEGVWAGSQGDQGKP